MSHNMTSILFQRQSQNNLNSQKLQTSTMPTLSIPHKPPPQKQKSHIHPVFLCHVFCSLISFPNRFQVMSLLWQTQQSVVIHLFTRCSLPPLELRTWRVPLALGSEGFANRNEVVFLYRNPKKNGRIVFNCQITPLATSKKNLRCKMCKLEPEALVFVGMWRPKTTCFSTCGGSKSFSWQGNVKLVFHTWRFGGPNNQRCASPIPETPKKIRTPKFHRKKKKNASRVRKILPILPG